MCSLLSNSVATKQFEELARAGQSNHERDLARKADEDSVETEASLGCLLKNVSEWSQLNISKVKKYSKGRHRFYIVGRHTECQYKVIFILINKRNEDDKPRQKNYQNMILKALSDESYRTIEAPQLPDQQENI